MCRDLPAFLCRPAARGRRRAVQVTAAFRREKKKKRQTSNSQGPCRGFLPPRELVVLHLISASVG